VGNRETRSPRKRVAEVRIFTWVSRNLIKDRIKNDNITKKLDEVSILE